MQSRISNKTKILLIILSIFIIASNLAWFNPFPDKEVYKTHPKIPFMWQYNLTSGVNILTAAYFPETYKTYKDRINRPVYFLSANIFGQIIGIIASPFVKLSPLEKAGLGFVILKILIYLLSAILLFKIFMRFFDEKISFLAVFVTYFHSHSIEALGTFHNSELQFITPIFILYMFLNIIDNYSLKKNIFFSLIIGLLFLAKQNYAVYLSIVLFSFFKKEWKKPLISIVVHLIPLGIYLLYLKIIDIPYYNHEAEAYGQGVWVLSFFKQNPIKSIKIIFSSLYTFLLHTAGYHTIFLVLSLLSFGIKKKIRLTNNQIIFIIIFIFSTWLQFLAAGRDYDYLTSDFSIIIFSIGVFALVNLLNNIQKYKKLLLNGFLLLWTTAHIVFFVNFPYVHPYKQKTRNTKVTKQRINMVEHPELYTNEDRENAKDGVIIEN